MNGSNGSVLRDWNSQISAAMFVLTLVFGVASLQGQETTDPVIFPPDDIFGRDAKSGNELSHVIAYDEDLTHLYTRFSYRPTLS